MYNNSAKSILDSTEEEVMMVHMQKGGLSSSKSGNVYEIFETLPDFPSKIKYKLYKEISSVSILVKKMSEKDKKDKKDTSNEKNNDIVNKLMKNIFLECNTIMLYDLINYIYI